MQLYLQLPERERLSLVLVEDAGQEIPFAPFDVHPKDVDKFMT